MLLDNQQLKYRVINYVLRLNSASLKAQMNNNNTKLQGNKVR